jgi:predicted ATP-dependent endonuclease of OLD family
MKLIKAEIKNYRVLHNVTITFDENATSIVGKNNSGKTSLSSVFNVFLTKSNKKPPFDFEDFSLASHCDFIKVYKLYQEITSENKEQKISEIQKVIPKIQLSLTIQYSESDNWSNIRPLFASLEESDEITILCEYAPDSTEVFLKNLHEAMKDLPYYDEALFNKIKSHYQNHYKINIRPYSKAEEAENISREDINKLIQIEFIDAQRVLDDSNAESRSKLSKIFQDQFRSENETDEKKSEELLQALETASGSIDGKLKTFFSPFVTYFNTFGFPGMGKEKVELKSQLEPEILFTNNVKLFYNHDGKSLPEKYNGLGYSNLICIIAQIIGFYNEIKDKKNNLNLIFIEEPEAHMHPQMQSVFIKNTIKFLKDVKLDAQVIMTTHSPHILSASNFESIRYFTPVQDTNTAIVKDMMEFNKKLTEKETKEFLRQYLTLGKCDLFFADKAVLFEGTVERILLPVFIEKIEKESKSFKLSEQYISAIEIGGAYINKFKELIEFLGIKTLIITDIDTVNPDSTKAEVESGKDLLTSNVTLKDWIPGKEKIDELLNKSTPKESADGTIRVTYQNNVNAENAPIKCGRSFEEAFIIDNHAYVFNNKRKLLSIKNHLKDYQDSGEIKTKSFEIQEFIDRNRKKTEFAFDLLNISKADWLVPTYIKEGLIWLA